MAGLAGLGSARPPPGVLYEYQNKALKSGGFCKNIILKNFQASLRRSHKTKKAAYERRL
jgi:hypothetical protein